MPMKHYDESRVQSAAEASAIASDKIARVTVVFLRRASAIVYIPWEFQINKRSLARKARLDARGILVLHAPATGKNRVQFSACVSFEDPAAGYLLNFLIQPSACCKTISTALHSMFCDAGADGALQGQFVLLSCFHVVQPLPLSNWQSHSLT